MMAERTVELDEPVMDEQSQALQNAVDRAERAEAELAKLKSKASHSAPAGTSAPVAEKNVSAAEGELPFPEAEVAAAPKQTGGATPVRHGAPTGATDEGVQHASEVKAPKGTSSTARPDPSGQHLVEPGSMDRAKQPAAQSPQGHAAGEPETQGIEALREDSMMVHLLDALGRGEDIGHYGRLTFTMIARHFLSDDEVLAELTKDRDFSEEQAKQMLVQVEGRDYSPPRRERILEWQAEQEFPIIPDRHDPDCGNVYKTLRFSKETYNHIGHYQEEKAS